MMVTRSRESKVTVKSKLLLSLVAEALLLKLKEVLCFSGVLLVFLGVSKVGGEGEIKDAKGRKSLFAGEVAE